MKRQSIYLALTALVAASMLSSCAFLQKGEFADRKYYNFPRSKHDVTETASVKEQDKTVAQPVLVQEEKKTAPVLSASVDKKEIIVTKTENTQSEAAKPVITAPASNNAVAESTDISIKKSDIRRQARKEAHRFTRGEASMMMFLAVVASIFFPPLGVYIKDHHTNKWFWITLLLCILGGGLYLFYTGVFGLLYLVAIIIALMDVFDLL